MKRLGDRISNDSSWIDSRQKHMEMALRAKFKDNDRLRQRLLGTGERNLVEANAYDTVWGIGIGLRNSNILDETRWKGTNLLGTLLVSLREEIKTW
jgi:ribA/ribD-fused uncharacterized protein